MMFILKYKSSLTRCQMWMTARMLKNQQEKHQQNNLMFHVVMCKGGQGAITINASQFFDPKYIRNDKIMGVLFR